MPPSSNNAYSSRKGRAGRVRSKRAVSFTSRASASLYGLPMALQRHCAKIIDLRASLAKDFITRGMGKDIKKHLIHASWNMPKDIRPTAHVSVVCHFKTDRKPSDIMNFEKLATDFLVDMGFILDDCLIDEFTIRRGEPDKHNPHLSYTIVFFNTNKINSLTS